MRLRFSIRDLLWLTALVAVLVAWWLDYHHRPNPDAYYKFGYKHGFNGGWLSRAYKEGLSAPGPPPYRFDDNDSPVTVIAPPPSAQP
jgi:hypothetical protein